MPRITLFVAGEEVVLEQATLAAGPPRWELSTPEGMLLVSASAHVLLHPEPVGAPEAQFSSDEQLRAQVRDLQACRETDAEVIQSQLEECKRVRAILGARDDEDLAAAAERVKADTVRRKR